VLPGLLAGTLMVGGGLVFLLAVPAVRRWNRTRQVDRILRTDPLFRVIVTDTPAVKEPLRRAMLNALETGGREEAFLAGNTLLSPLFPRYLARSSDAAIIDFARSVVTGLTDLAAHDPEDCYRYLFPQVAGPPSRRSAADGEVTAALRQVVASAQSSPRGPRETRPEALEPVWDRLRARHGENLSLLQRAESPGVDRKLICHMSIDLYNGIIQLPARDAAGGLRHLLGESAP
jgi:hypothetical protein